MNNQKWIKHKSRADDPVQARRSQSMNNGLFKSEISWNSSSLYIFVGFQVALGNGFRISRFLFLFFVLFVNFILLFGCMASVFPSFSYFLNFLVLFVNFILLFDCMASVFPLFLFFFCFICQFLFMIWFYLFIFFCFLFRSCFFLFNCRR